MKRLLNLILLLAYPLASSAQTQIQTTITPDQAAKAARISIPFPQTSVPQELINTAFFAPLTRDIAASDTFEIAVPGTEAHFTLNLKVAQQGAEYVVEARLYDAAGASPFAKAYRGPESALSRIAHTLANDLVRLRNGKPSTFLTQIAFASNRSAGKYEIWLMDWDGGNQRKISSHNALSILPSWSPDNERMVYTSFVRGTSDMYIINRRGGGRIRLPSGVNLNTSATFSPVGNDIAFVGSIGGNPDIYLIKDDGTNLRRLTSQTSIESTPEWSPNGRQISFTSGRSGTPQIYVMDAEGSNVRRISFDEGGWNDDATWSPDGEQMAYTSRVNGRFQIRIANVITRESGIVAGEGSNEQPTWSPDGKWIAFQSNRSGRWQIYRMRVDGNDLLQLTFDGENKDPDWSKKAE
jgi:TolB protein